MKLANKFTTLRKRSAKAVGVITRAIGDLQEINEDITDKMEDLEGEQSEIRFKRDETADALRKKIIENEAKAADKLHANEGEQDMLYVARQENATVIANLQQLFQ